MYEEVTDSEPETEEEEAVDTEEIEEQEEEQQQQQPKQQQQTNKKKIKISDYLNSKDLKRNRKWGPHRGDRVSFW